MTKNKRVFIAKATCITAAIPFLVYAYSSGPDVGFTGAPGDNKTACVDVGCHAGTINRSTGSVQIVPASGTTYAPGQAQVITIKISDPPQRSWGFQITARSESGGTQAGSFDSIDTNSQTSSTLVLCGPGGPAINYSTKSAGKDCPAQFPIQYAEHSAQGNRASRGSVGTYSFQIRWTAPATDVGPVTFYAAANASDGSDVSSAGHIYTTSLTLSPTIPGGPKPAFTSANIVNNATGLPSGVAPNTYLSIFGSNLATNTRTWAGSDFGPSGTALPTSLDGTSVSINGKPAYVEYISPTQLNVITPADTATGSGIPVTVTSGGQTSDVASITLNSIAPGFFLFDGKYVAASDALTGAFIGKTGLFASAPNLTTPAKPGQIITLYGTGFGATNPAIAAGIVTDKIYNLNPAPVINIGGTAAAVGFAALTPGFAQVYQFNVTIPANSPDGDLKIFAQTSGVSSPNTDACCYITVKK